MEQHLHREINELKANITKLGNLAEEAISKALKAMENGDRKLAKQVRKGDDIIDHLEVQIEEHILKMMALYQPVARDLRFLVTALKVNTELEHIGDLAEAIASIIRKVELADLANSKLSLQEMGAKVRHMVQLSQEAFLHSDSKKAWHVIGLDKEIDQIHRQNQKLIRTMLKTAPAEFNVAELDMLSASRALERMADSAGAIAVDVIYFAEARIVRHYTQEELWGHISGE